MLTLQHGIEDENDKRDIDGQGQAYHPPMPVHLLTGIFSCVLQTFFNRSDVTHIHLAIHKVAPLVEIYAELLSGLAIQISLAWRLA